jgi:hypothetical protein
LYDAPVEATDFDEDAFFAAVAGCGARALLIGRRAMVVLGAPVLTADYDLTKRFSARPKDLVDIDFLRALQAAKDETK